MAHPPNKMPPPIRPGTLEVALAHRTDAALAVGALLPIATRELRIDDHGVRFLVRQVDSLARKHAAADRSPGPGVRRPLNPFLPPESELTVGAVGDAHIAVLNKFNVLTSHLLVVTREFEDQETLLTPADFAALGFCLGEMDGFAFYNGGRVAGASQGHKHLQLVPLPLAPDGPPLPMGPLLGDPGATPSGGPPFRHALTRLDPGPVSAVDLHQRYLDLLAAIGIEPVDRDGMQWQSAPYNLLVTRRWMLAVPRKQEYVDGISINALGFAGSLFVKDETQLALVRRRGPMAVLSEAAGRG